MNHFTNKDGYNGIRSQPTWTFKALKPPARDNPVGAYFTDLDPGTERLAVRLRIPRVKLEYLFAFKEAEGLTQENADDAVLVIFDPDCISFVIEDRGTRVGRWVEELAAGLRGRSWAGLVKKRVA